jgi:hypothetical protein
MAAIAVIALSSGSNSSSTSSTALGFLILSNGFLLFFIVTAIVQLVLLYRQPTVYQRYRLVVHVVNRLVRLGMMYVVSR